MACKETHDRPSHHSQHCRLHDTACGDKAALQDGLLCMASRSTQIPDGKNEAVALSKRSQLASERCRACGPKASTCTGQCYTSTTCTPLSDHTTGLLLTNRLTHTVPELCMPVVPSSGSGAPVLAFLCTADAVLLFSSRSHMSTQAADTACSAAGEQQHPPSPHPFPHLEEGTVRGAAEAFPPRAAVAAHRVAGEAPGAVPHPAASRCMQ